MQRPDGPAEMAERLSLDEEMVMAALLRWKRKGKFFAADYRRRAKRAVV